MSLKSYQKWFTGNRILTNTINGATPPINESVPDRDAHWSSCTITADQAITIGSESYADGDLMIFSDGHKIYNRTGNVMNGSSNTGGIKSVPQSINIVKVPDLIASNIDGVDMRNKLYWVFSNALNSGIRIGKIDMTGDSGKGTFSNYTLSGQTPAGGQIGALPESERGIGGRMTTTCRRVFKAGATSYVSGFWIIAKKALNSGTGYWTDYGWHAWSITQAHTNGFPKITLGAPNLPIVSNVGTNYTGYQDNGPHGIVDITPVEIDPTGVNDHKIATIYRAKPGLDVDPQLLDKVEVLTFNGTTGAISNPTTKFTNGLDYGAKPWPIPGGIDSRYYNLYVCFSHDSTATLANLYYGNLHSPGPVAPTLQIAWNEIDASNTWSLTNLGAIDVNDNAGNNIWEYNQNSRIIGGIWRDPQKSGRIFISTPYKVDNFTLSVTTSSPVWSTLYPEVYGTFDSSTSNPIQHCILENVNAPATTPPTITMTGTLVDGTYYRYGAPQFIPCTNPVIVDPDLWIEKCGGPQYMLDTTKGLWRYSIIGPAGQSILNKMADLSQLSDTGTIGIHTNSYTDNLHIWDSPTGGNSLSYMIYNTDNQLVTNPQAISGATLGDYAKFMAIAHEAFVQDGSFGVTNPTTANECNIQHFIGLKAGETTKYGLGGVFTDTNIVSPYAILTELDTATAFSGALVGRVPSAMVVLRSPDNTTYYKFFVAIGERIVIWDQLTSSWSIVVSGLAGDITSMILTCSGVGTYHIDVTIGAAGSSQVYRGNPALATGMTFSVYSTSIITDPGAFTWLGLPLSATSQNAFTYFRHSQLNIGPTNPDFALYTNLCSDPNTDTFKLPLSGDHRGCFYCVDRTENSSHTEPCSWQQPNTYYPTCRSCQSFFDEDCVGFFPCCAVEYGPGNPTALGPIEMPGLVSNNTASATPGNVYSVSSGGTTPVCATAVTPTEWLWFTSTDGNIYDIDINALGTVSLSVFSAQEGTVPDLKDITFDKHGNVIYTSGVSDIYWASAWPGFVSGGELITNAFSVPECLDYDYINPGHIIGAGMLAGVATFTRYTNTLAAGITIVGTQTNATISLGYDLSVDYNSGDYFVLGDPTGAGALNSLISIDDANGNHTLISDLAVVCTFAAGQFACGIERQRVTPATSIFYVLSALPDGINNWQLFIHTIDDTGVTQVGVAPLINPVTATNAWEHHPTGLAFNDICSKWPNNTDPNLTLFTDCTDCLANPSTEDCCYKLTNCDTGLVQYSVQAILNPYLGQIIRLLGDTCWLVEQSTTCISPVTVILAAAPGPYADCSACEVPPPIYYKLPRCGDPTDVVYTVNGATAVSTPGIDGYYGAGVVVTLTGECFCREIQLNPSGPQGTEAALSIASTQVDCASCRYYIRIEDCVTGAITNVDYDNSPTLQPLLGSAQAHDITVGGVALTNCHKILVGCLGPTTTIYPSGVVNASYADCAACATAGQTCVKVSHCCGPTYVADQIVNVTTGITAADIGLVVQADITVGGIVYTGCWQVSANPDCVGVLPDVQVNAINTATVGTGNLPDCSYCLINPCDPQCTLLESCDDPGTTITVSGGLGGIIGSDVVELSGQVGCWKQCTSAGNPVAGTHWFYGSRLGIDFTSGAPVGDFNGQSTMVDYNSSNAAASDAYTFRGSACHSATGAATIGGHSFAAGDLMFYTDGHWIYDRTHTKMNLDSGATHEGDANQGLTSSNGKTFPAQGALVIPNAAGGVTNNVWHQYYIIQNSCGAGPIKWSLVDMTLNSGKGEVISASANTTLVASACEVMCVSTTSGIGSSAFWHFFYVPVMANGADMANQHIRAIKFDSGGVGASFVSVDVPINRWNTSDSQVIGSGELLINQTNDIIAYRMDGFLVPSENAAVEQFIWGLNPTTALSGTAAIGSIQNGGYNGGANNGPYSWINIAYQDQVPGLGGYVGDIGLHQVATWAFSADGNNLIGTYNAYYDPATPYTIDLPRAGWGMFIIKIKALAIEMNNVNGFVLFNTTDDAAVFDAAGFASPYMWISGSMGGTQMVYKSFPDASTASGWYGSPTDETRCNIVPNDLVVAPDGKLWINLVEQAQNDPYKLKVGAGEQITNSLLRLDDPNNATAIKQGLELINPVASYDIGNRIMGERFPVWLNMPCPCDPANVIVPDPTILNTLTDCTDCAPPPNLCYKLTECECTGGTAGPANQCSVNDPATMPPNMVTYGKTWSPTCSASGPERWSQIVTAVMNLGTSGAPGVAQTVNFSYSFINDGATYNIGYPGFGPSLAVEQGPGTANTTGISSSCATYSKTYSIDFAQFRAEMVTMFNGIKAMLEGMFNTNCGYGANLTINFTDLGYETGYTPGDEAIGANSIVSGNGTSFTDSNGVAGIGDFRIGFADFGAIDGPCGNTGAASSILGLCFTGDINNNITGVTRTSTYVGTLLFDANEDWRKASDPVVANSFSLIRVGMHEILHAFGYGHDWLTFGPLAAQCDCPCYQSDSTCPSMYPTPPGVIANSDALMGAFSTSNSFSTDFPTGLMGPEGIYDRRATCGIYGNSDTNYACQDGVCLQGTGCTYITEYSDDPALAGYVGGIITWDNGDPAGERCWEVDIVQPCPPGVALVNPVNLVSGDPNGDCTDCNFVNPCYNLKLCSCNTVPGAPAVITTNTDLSPWCNGTIGTGTIVEIDLYPGVCYEIECTPIPCPASGAVAVVITNTFQDCAICCSSNTQCYQLCPCQGGGSSTNTCATRTLMAPAPVSALQTYDQYSLNTPSDLHNTKKYIALGANSLVGGCVDPATGNAIKSFSAISFYKCGTMPNQPLDNMPQASYGPTSNWTAVRADLVAAGYGNIIMGLAQMYAWLQANYVSADGTTFCMSINGGPCFCPTSCTVVTNDLSAQLGNVVTLGGAPPAPLNTTECYEVELCGQCNTPACTPVGAVVINTVHPDCPDCQNSTACPCYKLVDCSDPTIVINNVCQSAALDTAFINGDIIQINGNPNICYEVTCDDIVNCDPATCLSVTVTGTFASCALCTGGLAWECNPLGGCICTQTAGIGFPSQAACLASQGCCPNVPSWDCDPLTGTCYDPGTGLGQYGSLLQCTQDCGTPESYNCLYSVATNSYTCADPGDGSGIFATLANCNMAVSSNTAPCNIESYNCEVVNGVTQCNDPGDGTGTFNNTNGGLAACQGCNGCPLDPTCTGVTATYDCDPLLGCILNYQGTGQYSTLQQCSLDCSSYEPEAGTYEAICENCLDEIDMKKFFDKVADICDDCNVPFGLTDQEVTCDTGCFGNSNIYVILDITSTFGGTYQDRLASMINFKVNVIEPAFAQIQSEYPAYSGHLYIIPGAWPHGSQFGPCNDCNGTGAAAPGSNTAPEDWLAWARYPLTGNAGANGAGANPMATGTLPANKRVVLGHTMVNGVGGAPHDCNAPAYDASVHGPLLEQIFILPGSYPTDGYNQVNPWQDVAGKEGFSDPYHEFEGGDTDAIVIIFQDESRGNPGGYHEINTSVNQWGGTCGNALWGGSPGLNWHSIGTGAANTLQSQWKLDYTNYMEVHEYGWDTSGNPLPASTSYVVNSKVMIYAGSYVDHTTTAVVDSRRDFLYHLFGAVGAQSKDAIISYNGHIDCASYVDVPTMYGFQCYVATDPTIPNPYMGASGGGDPTLVTGYQGGSLSNYGMTFHVPNYIIQDLSSTMLYDLWKEYLSDC